MNDERRTPQWFFDQLDAIFHFDLDVAATAENTKCRCFYTKEDDALQRLWGVNVWCNPPYSRGQLIQWVDKAAKETRRDLDHAQVVVMLTPGDFSTKWFQVIWEKADAIYFPSKRLAFDDETSGAKFASAVPIFGTLTCGAWQALANLPGKVLPVGTFEPARAA